METRPSRRELLAVGGLALLSSASLRALVKADEAEARPPARRSKLAAAGRRWFDTRTSCTRRPSFISMEE
jgi:hypothetical protein